MKSINIIIITFLLYSADSYSNIGIWEENIKEKYNSYICLSCCDSVNCITATNYGYIPTFGMIIKRSTDYGITWEPALIDTFNVLQNQNRKVRKPYKVHSNTNGIVIVLLNEGEIVRTTDYGNSWRYDTLGITEDFFNLYLNESIGIITHRGKPLKYFITHNSGETWEHKDMIFDYRWHFIYDVEIFSDKEFYFLTYDDDGHYILKTTDGGLNWTSQQTEQHLYEFDFVDRINGWGIIAEPVPGSSFTKQVIVKTSDGGNNWTRQRDTNALDFGFRYITMFDENRGIVAGYGGRIFRTYDGGNNWLKDSVNNAGKTIAIVDFHCTTMQNGFYVAGAEGLYSMNGLISGINYTYKNDAEVNIYPNPIASGDILTVETMKFQKKSLLAEIYDLTGRKVRSAEKLRSLSNCRYALTSPINLENGIYFLKLYDHSENYLVKLIIVG